MNAQAGDIVVIKLAPPLSQRGLGTVVRSWMVCDSPRYLVRVQAGPHKGLEVLCSSVSYVTRGA